MPNWDILIRGGDAVTLEGVHRLDIAIEAGTVADLSPDLPGNAKETIDATGLHIFPGLIDPHVHFNEPGRTDWEGFATGSAALAAGGGTCFFDMPLNSSPPTLDGPSFDLKRAAAEASSRTDFALWGGLTPANLDRLEELAERGVVGFKAFMCDSGISDFPRADDWTLYEGMEKAAKLGLPVAVHAENQELVEGRTRWVQRTLLLRDMLAWMPSRTPVAECDAVQTALLFAQFTKCAIHIVHMSTRYGIDLVAQFRAGGVDATCETCPHYLLLSSTDATAIGPTAKCAPPIRIEETRQHLWEAVRESKIEFIASDHSPSLPSMKSDPDVFRVWGGIAGVQSTLSALLTLNPSLPLQTVATLTSTNIVHRFNVPRKGRIEIGFDADLVLVDTSANYELRRDMLLDRHKLSPYVGRTFHGLVKRTIARGRTIFADGKMVGDHRGRLIKPARKA
jgi:allantoinase